MQKEVSAPLLQVKVADWGGTPDPYDLTPYVVGASVERSLRGGMGGAFIEVDDSEGAFDPTGGALRDVIKPNNGWPGMVDRLRWRPT